jgi:hypothetical protein
MRNLGPTRTYNVKDFGATGDGTTLDHTAVMAAVTAAANDSKNKTISGSNVGSVIYFPAGTYRISSPIYLDRNMHILGDGAPMWPYKSAMQSSQIRADTGTWSGAAVIVLRDKEQSSWTGENEGCSIRDIGVTTAAITGATPPGGIYATGHVQDVKIQNVCVWNVKGDGIKTLRYTRTDSSVQICSGWRLDHVMVDQAATAFNFDRLTDSNLYDCLATVFTTDGFVFTDPSDDHVVSSRSVFGTGYGFRLTGNNGSFQMTNCSTDRMTKSGFYFNFNDTRHVLMVNNCYARRDGFNDNSTRAGYAGMEIVGTGSSTPHCPVVVNGFGVHCAAGDDNTGLVSPDYGIKITNARQVSLNGVIVAGVVAALSDPGFAASIGPGCRWNVTGTDSSFTTTYDQSDGAVFVGADGVAQKIQFNVKGSGQRWSLGKGSDNNFYLSRYDSSGSFVDNILQVDQSDGRVGVGGAPGGKFHVESSASEIMLNLINNNADLGSGGLIKLLTAKESPVNSLQMGYKSDVGVRYNVMTDGKTEWGPGGSDAFHARDTNLYRYTTDTLATDDDFRINSSAKGLILLDTSGKAWRVKVSTSGALSATAV